MTKLANDWLPARVSVIPGPISASPSSTRGKNRMLESARPGLCGGLSNGHPYRDPRPRKDLGLDIDTKETLVEVRRGEHNMVETTPGNARFFRRSGPYPLAVVANAARGIVCELELLVEGVAPLQTAGPNDVSFLDNRRYASALDQTLAGAVIVHPDMAARVPTATVPILTTEPYAAWARVAALFYPVPPVSPGIHASAIVAEGALVDPSAEVGPLSVIETGAEIGPGCRIGPCAIIGTGVIVGRDCRIGAHASLSYAILGARVYVYPGARIGQEGFGFACVKDEFLSVPQLGRVILEDDVEVGANTTIDRGSSRDTVIGAGSRLDNLVQIGHNVILGRCCVIVAQVFRVRPCLRILSASEGRRLWPGIFGSVKVRR
jgi:UDP-3-O-[3-hydroxymyristoyl] glucosamine N-acyltransferase